MAYKLFQSWILRRIFGPKRDENGEWRRFHIGELTSLYRPTNIVRVIKYPYRRLRWTEGCRSALKILTGEPTVK
jgi:hypothetical protein